MAKWTPCDVPVEEIDEFTGKLVTRYKCPYCTTKNDYVSCRDMCGLGVDEDPEPYEDLSW